jgi:hypothetical protein
LVLDEKYYSLHPNGEGNIFHPKLQFAMDIIKAKELLSRIQRNGVPKDCNGRLTLLVGQNLKQIPVNGRHRKR